MTQDEREARRILSDTGTALFLGAEDPQQSILTVIERTMEVLKLTLASWKAQGRKEPR